MVKEVVLRDGQNGIAAVLPAGFAATGFAFRI